MSTAHSHPNRVLPARVSAWREVVAFVALAIFVFGAGTVCSALDAITERRRRSAVVEDDAVFLWAIRQVESGGRWDAQGAAGERGAYQFTLSTWRLCSAWPFYHASMDQRAAHDAAGRWLRICRAKLEHAGRPASVFGMALAWQGASQGAPTGEQRERAQRVVNLYFDRLEGVQ